MNLLFGFRPFIKIIVLSLCLLLFGACSDSSSNPSSSSEPFQLQPAGDYTQITWTEAFDALHVQISAAYAFTEWKGIDWEAMKAVTRPRIVQAEADGDEIAFVTALREYIFFLPDGHVSMLGGEIVDLLTTKNQCSFGMAITGLDDGRVVPYVVTDGGPAAEAGIEVGDEIVAWDGLPIALALTAQSILWTYSLNPPATNEHKLLKQYQMLVIRPEGSQSAVTFRKDDGGVDQTVTLTATDDEGEILKKSSLWKNLDINNLVHYRLLPSGYGYLFLGALLDVVAYQEGLDPLTPIYDKFKEAIQFFTDQDVPGIIVDLRANMGGSDFLAADLSGFFYQAPVFYEYQNWYNNITGAFENILLDDENEIIGRNVALDIPLQTPYYEGPVIVIVNPLTISSGEGVAMAIQNLPQGQVLGFWGTNGSFGMTGGEATMPGGYKIQFPYGQSLNSNRKVQLDSRNGVGGVQPDIATPKTLENMVGYSNGEDVELDYAVQTLQGL
jgi:carboxyl-terminal processing protease